MSTQFKKFTLDELETLLANSKGKIEIVLNKASKWMEWESSAFLLGDAKVVAIDRSKKWPLRVSFTGSTADAQDVEYNPEMEFVCKSK